MVEHIAWFKDISKDSIAVAGGKGANLGEMYNVGLPVPAGFIVTAQTYAEFIERAQIKDKIAGILAEITDYQDNDILQAKANEIQKLIIDTEVPEDIAHDIVDAYNAMDAAETGGDPDKMLEHSQPFVAVRSSATAEDLPEASFAGQQATFLNIKGDAQIVTAVRACWASLFTARATYYRSKNDFDHMKVLISVVVQKMVNSDAAGVMFSANPATNELNEIVIEAGWGLGEAVVSGSINPDNYIVDKTSMEIKKKEVKKQAWGLFRNKDTGENEKRNIDPDMQDQQILTEPQIMGLAELAKKIEDHYGKPQDMEFAVEGGKLFITQSRAITTIKPKEPEPAPTQEATTTAETATVLAKGETASPGIAYGPVKVVREVSELSKIEKGDVLVATMTTPDMVPAMQRAAAIVTDEGGMTCHAAIVSREMGTPCIVGTENGTQVLSEHQIITVNATDGIVYDGKLKEAEPAPAPVQAACPQPEIITATRIKVIMDLPDFAQHAADTGADGVGLVRVEIMIANCGIHPAQFIRENRDDDYTNMLVEGIGKIAKCFKGKPVWVRTSDIRTDEYRNLQGGDQEPHETDPMIGWHAIRRALDEPRILKAEFKAIKILHDQGVDNVGVMLPFVIRAIEVRKAKEIMREVGLEPCRDVDFGVMCETPASVWVMDEICREGITFVSFGTNDLTQLTLGIDRNNERIAKLFDEMHPAVRGEISMVVNTCKKYGVQTSICGQAGSRPEMAEFLVHIGIDSISANPDAVHQIRKTVAETERKLILDAERKEMNQN
ncbi:phosphoenolpyruvate synthase [Thermoproteota archaeon]